MASHAPNGHQGITIKTAPHGANKISSYQTAITSPEELLRISCPEQSKQCKTHLQSSFQPHLSQPQSAPLYASSNGFVNGAIEAYNRHHHFVIRPEDVWVAIITQFSCYVNAHAEDLRSKFVSHEGQKELRIEMTDLHQFDVFAERMSRLLEKNIVDPELREWILPAFSTTTREDEVVASILMMGTLQKYFTFTGGIMCGLPSVTLLGTEGDWENILLRVEKLKDYGEEPTIWSDLLKPVLARFVKSFQSPDSEEVLDFWQKIVHEYNMGSGPTYLSGWITAFCFWNDKGALMYRKREPPSAKEIDTKLLRRLSHRSNPEAQHRDRVKDWNGQESPHLTLDGASYHRVDLNKVPSGFGSVPVHVDDNGREFDTTMVAGSVGIKGTSSGRPLHGGETGLDTMQPVTGWWIFSTPDAQKKDPVERVYES